MATLPGMGGRSFNMGGPKAPTALPTAPAQAPAAPTQPTQGWQQRLSQMSQAARPPAPNQLPAPPSGGELLAAPSNPYAQNPMQPPQMQPPSNPYAQNPMQPPQMQPPKATNFNQHMRNMRKNYRGSMEAGGLPPNVIRQKMQAMRKDQRLNRSAMANQYMREQTRPQQPPPPPQQQAPQYAQLPPRRPLPGMQPPPQQAPQYGQLPPRRPLPGMQPQNPQASMEQFNQRGTPTPSRANLLPAQQPGSWAQRMYGGMRGAPRVPQGGR